MEASQLKVSSCKSLVVLFFLMMLGSATSSLAAGQWDGTWTGALRQTGPICKFDLLIQAEVKDDVFRVGLVPGFAYKEGSHLKLTGRVRKSGKASAHGTWRHSETMDIRGRFSTEHNFAGKYSLGRCQGTVHLTKFSDDLDMESVGDIEEMLQQAVAKGDVAAVNQLIAKGANVNTSAVSFGAALPLLHLAIREDYIAVAELLLVNGADIDARDPRVRTALHWAAYEGRKAAANLLIDKGANVNAKDLRKRTPLHWAVGNGHEAVVERLIAKGADVNAKAKKGVRPLQLATEGDHEELVELLKRYGAKE